VRRENNRREQEGPLKILEKFLTHVCTDADVPDRRGGLENPPACRARAPLN
jgi:hypothetical protein